MSNKIKFLTDILDSSGNVILSRDDICYSLLDILKALYGEELFVIPRGTTEITAEAYKENNNIKTVFIPATVTKIGEGAFSNSTSLSNVVIPNSVTSIERDAFANCTELQSICVDTDNTVYQSIDGNLYSKDGETLIAYAIGKTDQNFVIPYGVKTVGRCAFRSCSSLTSVEVPDTVTIMNVDAFAHCTNLEKVELGTNIIELNQGVFYNCNNLKEITIPNNVTTLGPYVFSSCDNLIAIKIGSNVDTIDREAFSYCNKLEKIIFNGTMEKWKSQSITKAGDWNSNTGIFVIYCTNGILDKNGNELQELTIAADNRALVGFTDTNNEELSIPKILTDDDGTMYLVTAIGGSAFSGCYGLTSVTIPYSVTTINNRAFYYCNNLTSVTIPSSVTTIGNQAFYNCYNLKRVYIYDIALWCNIAFGDYSANPLCCAKNLYLINNDYSELITDLVVPNSVTSIGDFAFYNCDGLTSVTIPDSVTTIGNEAFRYCSALTSITIPDSVISIGTGVFEGCSSLTNISIPNTVTTISDYMFKDCDGLTSVTIPDYVTSIGDYAFYGCDGLTSVTLHDRVTNIGKYVFYDCNNLTSVTIPSSLTTIGEDAFNSCDKLTSVTFNGSMQQWKNAGGSTYLNTNSNSYTYCNDSFIEAGTYTFKDTVVLPERTVSQDLTCNTSSGAVLKNIAIDNSGIGYTSQSGSTITVYRSDKWTNSVHKTITLDTRQKVSLEFYTWFYNNKITGGSGSGTGGVIPGTPGGDEFVEFA